MITVPSSLVQLGHTVGLQAKKYGPQIMIVGGVIGGAATTVLACIATKKAIPIVEDAKNKIADIQSRLQAESLTEEEAKAERRKVYLGTTGKLVKVYAPAACTGAASVAGILGGTGILNSRNAVLASSLATTTLGFNEYRERAIAKFGEEIDHELRYGTTQEKIEATVTDEDGNEKTEKKKADVVRPDGKLACDYRRVFDWHNPFWRNDPIYNRMFVNHAHAYAQALVDANGYLFWNESLKSLGFKKVKPGQVVGWTKGQKVDFRIKEAYQEDPDDLDSRGNPKMKPVILLDFNCDGSILNKVNWDQTLWEMN